jgi:DNA modification methylase
MIYQKNSPPLTHKRYEQNFEYMFILCKGKIKTFNPIYRKKIYKDTRIVTQNRREKNGEFSKGFRSKSKETIKGNIWKYSVGGGISSNDKISFLHPAIFPEQLVKEHIYSWSNEGDLIYDCFMGSGTTAKMAHLQKRNWIGSEISKEYTELANKRIKKYINQTSLF